MSETKKVEFSPSVSVLVAGVLIAGAIIFVNQFPGSGSAAAVVAGQEYIANANVRAPQAGEPRYGSADAEIVLIEYSDLECVFCARAHPTLKRIVDESAGKVAWVYRHFPLESIHPQARPAAVASECLIEQLGSDAFWPFADAMFANQQGMSAAYYTQVAVQLGAEESAFAECVASDRFGSKVDSDATEAIQNGGQGTPFTVVYTANAQVPVSGALPYAQFMSVINSL